MQAFTTARTAHSLSATDDIVRSTCTAGDGPSSRIVRTPLAQVAKEKLYHPAKLAREASQPTELDSSFDARSQLLSTNGGVHPDHTAAPSDPLGAGSARRQAEVPMVGCPVFRRPSAGRWCQPGFREI